MKKINNKQWCLENNTRHTNVKSRVRWSSLNVAVAVLTNLTGWYMEVPLHRTWGIQFHSIRLTFLENSDTQVLTEQTHLILQTNKSVGITSRASTPIHATTATSLQQPGKNSPGQAMHATLAAMMMGGWVDVSDLCVSECSKRRLWVSGKLSGALPEAMPSLQAGWDHYSHLAQCTSN